jgi:hypothetical protein
MRRDGDVSNSYIDSFALPRGVFGRFAALSDAFTAQAVYLEYALPTAMCMTGWSDDRVGQVRWSKKVAGEEGAQTYTHAQSHTHTGTLAPINPPQRCSYVYDSSAVIADVIKRWSPVYDWLHPWKLGRSPELRAFMQALKANYSARPDAFDDFNMRAPLSPGQYSCT